MDQKIKDLIKFNIIDKAAQSVQADMLVREELPSFAGHFPGNPILPAVSIIDISLLLLSEVGLQVSHSKISVKRSKFKGMIRPNQKVKILAESEDSQNWKIIWTTEEEGTRLASVHLSI